MLATQEGIDCEVTEVERRGLSPRIRRQPYQDRRSTNPKTRGRLPFSEMIRRVRSDVPAMPTVFLNARVWKAFISESGLKGGSPGWDNVPFCGIVPAEGKPNPVKLVVANRSGGHVCLDPTIGPIPSGLTVSSSPPPITLFGSLQIPRGRLPLAVSLLLRRFFHRLDSHAAESSVAFFLRHPRNEVLDHVGPVRFTLGHALPKPVVGLDDVALTHEPAR